MVRNFMTIHKEILNIDLNTIKQFDNIMELLSGNSDDAKLIRLRLKELKDDIENKLLFVNLAENFFKDLENDLAEDNMKGNKKAGKKLGNVTSSNIEAITNFLSLMEMNGSSYIKDKLFVSSMHIFNNFLPTGAITEYSIFETMAKLIGLKIGRLGIEESKSWIKSLFDNLGPKFEERFEALKEDIEKNIVNDDGTEEIEEIKESFDDLRKVDFNDPKVKERIENGLKKIEKKNNFSSRLFKDAFKNMEIFKNPAIDEDSMYGFILAGLENKFIQNLIDSIEENVERYTNISPKIMVDAFEKAVESLEKKGALKVAQIVRKMHQDLVAELAEVSQLENKSNFNDEDFPMMIFSMMLAKMIEVEHERR